MHTVSGIEVLMMTNPERQAKRKQRFLASLKERVEPLPDRVDFFETEFIKNGEPVRYSTRTFTETHRRILQKHYPAIVWTRECDSSPFCAIGFDACSRVAISTTRGTIKARTATRRKLKI